MKANFHTHSTFCDGKASAEDMVLSAIQKGFTALGFSSHCIHPMDPDFYSSVDSLWHIPKKKISNYVAEIKRLKIKYDGQIKIYLGFEADYFEFNSIDALNYKDLIEQKAVPNKNSYSKYSPDFLIGAVHFVDTETGFYTVDHHTDVVEKYLKRYYPGENGKINGKKAVCDYFAAEREMLKKGNFDIIAHPDLIRKRNGDIKFFSEKDSWYKEEIRETAKAIKKAGVIAEINTGAIARGAMDDVYPSAAFLQMLYDNHVPVCISSDAHTTDGLDCAYDRAIECARKAGYTELNYPDNIVIPI